MDVNVSRKFWKDKNKYPDYGPLHKRRRIYEMNFLTNFIWENEIESLVDLGCGDGSTVILLRELTSIKQYSCFDISQKLLDTIDTRDRNGIKVSAKVSDLSKPEDYPKADLTIAMGSMMYIPDEQVRDILTNRVKSDLLILRDPLYEDKRVNVNTYSEQLQAEYSAVYRTVNEMISILTDAGFGVEVSRAFPDDIESKFGSKQYFFICTRK